MLLVDATTDRDDLTESGAFPQFADVDDLSTPSHDLESETLAGRVGTRSRVLEAHRVDFTTLFPDLGVQKKRAASVPL